MSFFKPVALEHASRLINHGPTVLVTSRHGGERNIMAAAWSMPVEFRPPRIAIVIDKGTWTAELVKASGVFGVCLPTWSLAAQTFAVGSETGRGAAKFEKFGLVPKAGEALGVPLLEDGCAAWMECRLIPEPHTQQAYDTCFAEVVNAAADERVFKSGRWDFAAAPPELQTIHHLGAGNFVRSSGMFNAGRTS